MTTNTAISNTVNTINKQPIYFLSHGGPTFLDENDEFGSNKGAFRTTRKIGDEIKKVLNPDYIVVLSGHWQAYPESQLSYNKKDAKFKYGGIFGNKNNNHVPLVQVATPAELLNKIASWEEMENEFAENKLIYDFYGFPDYLYKETFKSVVSTNVLARIRKVFEQYNLKNGVSDKRIDVEFVRRDIDHGVWVPLKVAQLDDLHKMGGNSIGSGSNNAPIPIVQMSLLADNSFSDHFYKLGDIIKLLRKDNAMVICSGMSVHNLGDLRYIYMDTNGNKFPYVLEFNNYLHDLILNDKFELSVQKNHNKLFDGLQQLNTDPNLIKLLYKAHPTLDHFLPFVAACGGMFPNEFGVELYNDQQFSLGWGIYKYGGPDNNLKGLEHDEL
ncbi:uncharacterized protein SCODWIG_01906 [Saccharomycodes ludwigii]|uniref:Extradiol ring-cleavage dioxygenase class III enzyme subunit B domain-containing protein n=1 Tax=Saccharomycodes ludwigii TaxID=36035 RepID=A0A376B623_9ASCO|nr:hypothetical protein SCDLUD_000870 [Saccharomycodes ludwigii]KAH3903249.1 hypothetical protein SCDLUD_000870 [Saccharomycodes ludwigii]SSD60145.1 uncharacterized protein SCODWIG_01906 [Saccharomycodes ludwigii]